MAVYGTMTRDVFRVCAEPSLRPGDIVVLDNPASHKDLAALEMIQRNAQRTDKLPAVRKNIRSQPRLWETGSADHPACGCSGTAQHTCGKQIDGAIFPYRCPAFQNKSSLLAGR